MTGIAVEAGLLRVGNNRRLYGRLLLQFRKGYGDAVDRLQRLIEAGDLEGALHLTHSVKGVAGNLGADALSEAAAALESGFRTGEIRAPEEALRSFANRLDELIDTIGALEPPETDTVPNDPVDAATVEPLLIELAGLLETDLAAATEVLEAIRGLPGDTEAFERLAEHMENFDTDQALESLREIASTLGIRLES